MADFTLTTSTDRVIQCKRGDALTLGPNETVRSILHTPAHPLTDDDKRWVRDVVWPVFRGEP